MDAPNDCMVLKIEEYDDSKLDTSIFILYDSLHCEFIVRGKRRETSSYNTNAYSYKTSSIKSLYEFIKFVIPTENMVSLYLYNYIDLPESSDDITFEYLLENEFREEEIVVYDNEHLHKRLLKRLFRIIKNIKNDYDV